MTVEERRAQVIPHALVTAVAPGDSHDTVQPATAFAAVTVSSLT